MLTSERNDNTQSEIRCHTKFSRDHELWPELRRSSVQYPVARFLRASGYLLPALTWESVRMRAVCVSELQSIFRFLGWEAER